MLVVEHVGAASVTIYVTPHRVDVQSIEQLLARERNRLTVKAIVVVVSRATAARGRDRQRSTREAVLSRLLLMS